MTVRNLLETHQRFRSKIDASLIELAALKEHSERTAREIDIEVRSIIEEATREVRAVLQMRRGALEAIAQRLIEKEVIEGSELRQVLELHTPGPRLLPGSEAVIPPPELPPEQPDGATAEPSL